MVSGITSPKFLSANDTTSSICNQWSSLPLTHLFRQDLHAFHVFHYRSSFVSLLFFSPAVRFDSLRSFWEIEDGLGFEGICMFWMLGSSSPCAWPGPTSFSPLHSVSGFLFFLFLVDFFSFLLQSPAVPRTLFTFSRATHRKEIDILQCSLCTYMKMNRIWHFYLCTSVIFAGNKNGQEHIL